MTTLKFIYNDQIHKVSPLPKTFCSLSSTLQLLLKNSLPESYALQYQDSEGERVMLTGEEDYKAMLMTELPQDPNKSVRIYICSRDDRSQNKSFINNSYTSTENTRRSNDLSSHGTSSTCLKALQEAESNSNAMSECMKAIITCPNSIAGGVPDCSSDEDDKDDDLPCEFAAQKAPWGNMEKDDMKKQKKLLKKEIRIQRHMQKSEFMKGMVVDLLYDNFANLARIVGAYVRDPNTDLDRLVSELRPKTFTAETLEALTKGIPQHGKPAGGFRPMPPEEKKRVNGVPEKTFTRAEHHKDVERERAGGYFAKKIKCPIAQSRENEKALEAGGRQKDYYHEEKPRGKPVKEDSQPTGGPKLKWIPKQEPYHNMDYSMEFVKEVGSVPNFATPCDSVIYKTILIRNNGSKEWPRSAILIPKGEIRSDIVRLKNLRPGEEISPVLVLKSPCVPGDYISDWKLAYKDEQGRTIYTSASIKVNLRINKPEGNTIDARMMKACPTVMKKIEELKKIYPQTDCNFILDVIKQAPDSSIGELIQELKKRLS